MEGQVMKSSDIDTRDTMEGLGRYMQSVGDRPAHVLTGDIAGTSHLTQDGSVRPQPRLYIDLDGNPPIEGGRVYIITIKPEEERH